MTETAKNDKKLYYFYAKWCEYCTTMTRVLERDLSSESVILIPLDIDQHEAEMAQWHIHNIPVAVLVDSDTGERLSTLVGAPNEQHVINWLEQTGLYSPKKIAA